MIQLFGVHQAAALENAHGELGDDGQVALEVLTDDLAELFIVFQGFDFFKLAKGVKRLVIELVDFFDVWVCYNNVGELLHVTDPMRNSIGCISQLASSNEQNENHDGIPDWKFRSNIVCRTYKSRLGQGASKHHQLAQADGACLFRNPSTQKTTTLAHALA